MLPYLDVPGFSLVFSLTTGHKDHNIERKRRDGLFLANGSSATATLRGTSTALLKKTHFVPRNIGLKFDPKGLKGDFFPKHCPVNLQSKAQCQILKLPRAIQNNFHSLLPYLPCGSGHDGICNTMDSFSERVLKPLRTAIPRGFRSSFAGAFSFTALYEPNLLDLHTFSEFAHLTMTFNFYKKIAAAIRPGHKPYSE